MPIRSHFGIPLRTSLKGSRLGIRSGGGICFFFFCNFQQKLNEYTSIANEGELQEVHRNGLLMLEETCNDKDN